MRPPLRIRAAAQITSLTSQCVFGTSTARSVSLTVTRANPAGGSTLSPRAYWRQQFHRDEHEKERDTEARLIAGVGEEAYWTGNRFAGALYALRGDMFLRISVGGIRDEQARVNGVCAAAGSGSSLPQAHGGLLGGFSQRSVFAAQHEFSSLRQLEVGGVIHR